MKTAVRRQTGVHQRPARQNTRALPLPLPEWLTTGLLDDLDWPTSEVPINLDNSAVYVWRFRLRPCTSGATASVEQAEWDRLRALLSPEEQARHDRYQRSAPREQFITARAVLRCVLGRCIGVAPHSVALQVGPFGKPLLTDGSLQFNFSHAGNLGLLAVSADRQVGIDLEPMRAAVRSEEIASRFFAPGERAALRNSRVDEASSLFFRIWTRKEALLKATGKGLTVPLNSFDLSALPTGPFKWINGEWSLTDLFPHAGYLGALATEHLAHRPLHLRCLTLTR